MEIPEEKTLHNSKMSWVILLGNEVGSTDKWKENY